MYIPYIQIGEQIDRLTETHFVKNIFYKVQIRQKVKLKNFHESNTVLMQR